jgi:phosphoserine phosphatase RsbU/P
MKALIAEDDEASRTILSAQLHKLGYDVVETEDGALAWEAFQRELPSVVITDWIMPHVDGLELCRRIRSFKRPEYTYIIILTALDRRGAYLEGMRSGADDFITKPAEVAELTVRLGVARRILALQIQKHQLEILLPMCPKCKRIHAGGDRWESVEGYISERSDATFSHGICPECYEKIIQPQLAAIRRKTQSQGS